MPYIIYDIYINIYDCIYVYIHIIALYDTFAIHSLASQFFNTMTNLKDVISISPLVFKANRF